MYRTVLPHNGLFSFFSCYLLFLYLMTSTCLGCCCLHKHTLEHP